VKRIVALLLIFAMSAMLFSCGEAPATSHTSGSAEASSTTKNPDEPVPSTVSPYADIDFFGGNIEDNKGKIALEVQPAGSPESVTIEEKIIEFAGKEKSVPVLCIRALGARVKGVFSDFENNTEFDAFVAENGGFSIEVFYLDNSTTGASRGIVCSTESIGGDSKRSGWGIAESAGGAPYFITGHTAENVYSSVYAKEAPQNEPVHVVGVYNSAAKRIAIYVNGTLVSSDSAAGAFTSANKTDVYGGFLMATAFYIGADPSSVDGKPEKCDFPSNNLTVLDLKFYACALTDAEVNAAFLKSASVFD
jgi:hypothetical protein